MICRTRQIKLKVVLPALMSGMIAGLFGCVSSPAVVKGEYEFESNWRRRTTVDFELRSRFIEPMQPRLYNGKLIIYGNAVDSLLAYSLQTGDVVWRKRLENGASGGVAVVDNSIFFGGNDGFFYRLKADTGETVWSFPTRTETLSKPLVEDGTVYFLAGNNTLYSLDADSGEQRWIYSRRDTSAFSVRGGSRPVIRAGKLFVGFSDGSVVAFNASNGRVLWEQQLNSNKKFRDIDSDPVVSGFSMIFSGYDDAVYSLDWSTGRVNWKYGKGSYGTPLVTRNKIFLPTTEGELVCLDKDSGREVWSIPTKGVATSPSLYKNYLVFGESAGNLRMVSSYDGRDVTHFQPGRGVFSRPLVQDDGTVIFSSNQSNLYSMRIRNKTALGRWGWE